VASGSAISSTLGQYQIAIIGGALDNIIQFDPAFVVIKRPPELAASLSL